ncbi:MAG: copper chaperone PCu(A)C [Xanthobacteraceae bacterium]|jgi:copper(I)-binding protein
MMNFTGKSKAHRVAAMVAALASPLILAQVASLPAQAADYDVGSMHISQPWARATPKGASSAAGYMTITNKGATADRVSCVSSDAAAQCQIHSMTMDGGVMKMRPVEGGLEIKPGETVTLQPGGFHMMLVDLKHPLEAGQDVKATLKFDQAGTVEVDYPVAAIGAPAPGAVSGGGMMMGDHGGGMMMQNSGGGMMQMDRK